MLGAAVLRSGSFCKDPGTAFGRYYWRTHGHRLGSAALRRYSSFADGMHGRNLVPLPSSAIHTRVTHVEDATPSTKVFTLETQAGEPEVTFQPGQWCDVMMPVLDTARGVGAIPLGLSICNSPPSYSSKAGYASTKTLLLACKYSYHPLVRYLHSRARPHHTLGTSLYVSHGQGEFCFVPGMSGNVVLFGGGIGITPLFSIARTIHRYHEQTACTLLHCVHDPKEFLFEAKLTDMARARTNVEYLPICSSSKLSPKSIERYVEPGCTYFLCGPEGFVQYVYAVLRGMGVTEEQCVYEKWIDCSHVLPSVP